MEKDKKPKINVEEVRDFWLEEASEAMKVAQHLFEKEDFSYCLFFAHLAIEKLLKAMFVSRKGEHAPTIHNLQRLAELSGIELKEDRIESLIKITRFNIEARYPDQKRSFRKKCNRDFTENELRESREVFLWLKSMIQS